MLPCGKNSSSEESGSSGEDDATEEKRVDGEHSDVSEAMKTCCLRSQRRQLSVGNHDRAFHCAWDTRGPDGVQPKEVSNKLENSVADIPTLQVCRTQ